MEEDVVGLTVQFGPHATPTANNREQGCLSVQQN
jgi:hypothetical protein